MTDHQPDKINDHDHWLAACGIARDYAEYCLRSWNPIRRIQGRARLKAIEMVERIARWRTQRGEL